MSSDLRYDEIGYWSEVKLDIIREYAAAYSRIIRSQTKKAQENSFSEALPTPYWSIHHFESITLLIWTR